MNRNDMITYALHLDDALEDYPFDDPDFTILRHKSNNKWFAMLFTLNERICMNVKTSPWEVDALCETYNGITPGWHMNKRHWITVDLNSDVAVDDMYKYLYDSYMVTLPTKKRKSGGVHS